MNVSGEKGRIDVNQIDSAGELVSETKQTLLIVAEKEQIDSGGRRTGSESLPSGQRAGIGACQIVDGQVLTC
jgi:hypothetical protein